VADDGDTMRAGDGKGAAGSPGFGAVDSASCATRDREAVFRADIEPEIDVLLRVGYSLTGSWVDAEDLVQDTLIRAWRALDRFDGAHPRAWLLTILRRTHLNSLRRHRPDVTGDPLVLERGRPAFGATPGVAHGADQVVDRQLGDELGTAVAALGETFRVVLLLIDVDQLTYAEAAAVLGVPVGTVYSRLSRARDRVRRQLPSGYLGYGHEGERR